ncbi:MAG TPA: response regulator [Alloacidobacterium sp.]|nr:response regulator [Alloacidobacterium sp.]
MMHSSVARKPAPVFRDSQTSWPALKGPPITIQKVIAFQKILDDSSAEIDEGTTQSLPSPTVHIVDYDPHLRHTLSRLLRSYDYRVQSYADSTQFLRQDISSGPACLVLDLDLPEISGLVLQRILSRKHGSLSVIFVSSQADIKTSVRAMKAGAIDFLMKPVSDSELLSAIETGLAISEKAFAKQKELEKDQTAFIGLSPREQDVCLRIAHGLLNKQIAFELGTSEKTIKAQRSNVMKKLGADSLPDVVRLVERLRTSNAIPTISARPPFRRPAVISRATALFSC